MDIHGGQLNDSRSGIRMKGEGKYAEMIAAQFQLALKRHLPNQSSFTYDLTQFEKARKPQTSLLDML
jgi:hypothetical protein